MISPNQASSPGGALSASQMLSPHHPQEARWHLHDPSSTDGEQERVLHLARLTFPKLEPAFAMMHTKLGSLPLCPGSPCSEAPPKVSITRRKWPLMSSPTPEPVPVAAPQHSPSPLPRSAHAHLRGFDYAIHSSKWAPIPFLRPTLVPGHSAGRTARTGFSHLDPMCSWSL